MAVEGRGGAPRRDGWLAAGRAAGLAGGEGEIVGGKVVDHMRCVGLPQFG